MKMLMIVGSLFVLMSCQPEEKKQPIQVELVEQSERSAAQTPDSLLQEHVGDDVLAKGNEHKSEVKKSPIPRELLDEVPIRMANGPSGQSGEIVVNQLDFPKEIRLAHPDTLKKLAVAYYFMHERSYPRSIADNFDEGISTEFIHYPSNVVFRFELFQNSKASKPYAVEDVRVVRNRNGEVYAE